MGLALLLTLKTMRMRMTKVLVMMTVMSATPQAGSSEECKKPGFWVDQPAHLSAPEGDSVSIPFSFDYPWEVDKDSEVDIAWRWKGFHGEFIYNKTQNSTHKAFQNRLFLHLTNQWKNGSLQIRELRREDATSYFCRMRVKTKRCGWQLWGSVPGTKLTISPARKISTTSIPATIDTTTELNTSGSHCEPGGSGSGPLSVEAVVGVAVLSSVLKAAILGLAVYPRWRKSQR